jgi:hypothetical protein
MREVDILKPQKDFQIFNYKQHGYLQRNQVRNIVSNLIHNTQK